MEHLVHPLQRMKAVPAMYVTFLCHPPGPVPSALLTWGFEPGEKRTTKPTIMFFSNTSSGISQAWCPRPPMVADQTCVDCITMEKTCGGTSDSVSRSAGVQANRSRTT